MKIKGIKRGKTIEISEALNIPDGTEIIIDIEIIQSISHQERLKKMQDFLSNNKEDREDFVKTMEEFLKEENLEWERLYGQYS
ncbi:hypothetical protein [Calothrix sp. PCC 7507]|uniref:hypothetical protein n=1 Tax=Calothrix sp. PCC 7507 TaxID=99598 RepID=UPI00029F3610|nr:hypothetical protein [Calothrix sp. PCC 7507]AFY33550.1 hypothetical protein Cal7507_3141 [Calothrix sp. PCC 7507]